MNFQRCKFFPYAVVYNKEDEYSLIRSACGPSYDYASSRNRILCPSVGLVVECEDGHKMTYLTSELKQFAGKASVKCRVCGRITFVRDAELYCMKSPDTCKEQL